MGAQNSVAPAIPQSSLFCYFLMPQSKLSGVNLFDLKFSACVLFSNRLS